jgi:hypothetical protein
VVGVAKVIGGIQESSLPGESAPRTPMQQMGRSLILTVRSAHGSAILTMFASFLCSRRRLSSGADVSTRGLVQTSVGMATSVEQSVFVHEGCVCVAPAISLTVVR